MVEFSFDAHAYQPSLGWYETREGFALRLWQQLTWQSAEVNNPAEAIERARWDPDVWHALKEHLRATPHLPDTWKLATFDLWLNGPPKKPHGGKALPTAMRDRAICYVMQRLCEEYGVNPTRSVPNTETSPDRDNGVGAPCAASILKRAISEPGFPSEGELANIWSRR